MTAQDGVTISAELEAGYEALIALVLGTAELPAGELHEVVDAAGQLLGATSARLLVADYGLLSLQELGRRRPEGRTSAHRRHPCRAGAGSGRNRGDTARTRRS